MQIRHSSPRRLRRAMAGRRSGRTFWSDLKRISIIGSTYDDDLSRFVLPHAKKLSSFRSMLIAYSFTHLARMCPYSLSSFALTVLGRRRHSGTDSAHWGIPGDIPFTLPTASGIPCFLLVSLCCCKTCSILKSLLVASLSHAVTNIQRSFEI